MNEKIQKHIQPKLLTPLWIIALFVSLAETVLGIAVMQTTDTVQLVLTTFVIGFPLLVAGAFFAILWNRPEVLYAPTEYGKETDVTSFVDAMRRKPLDEQKLYAEIKTVIEETSAKIKIDLLEIKTNTDEKVKEESINRILDAASHQAVEEIRKVGFLMLDSRPLLGNDGKVWQILYQQYNSVSSLLNAIWFSLGNLPALTYDEKWILRNSADGSLLAGIGYEWAEERGMGADTRSLDEVGIKPGMIFEVTKP